MISRSSAPAIAAEAGALKRTAGTGGSGRTFSTGSREKYGPTDPEPHVPTKRAKTFNHTE